MLESAQSNSICELGIDPSVPCVAVRWYGYATSPQLREAFETIIYLLKTNRLSKIFADNTELPTIHAENQTWIVSDWLPRALAAGLRAMAVKHPSSHFGKVSTEAVRTAVSPQIMIQSFDSTDAARLWLQEAP